MNDREKKILGKIPISMQTWTAKKNDEWPPPLYTSPISISERFSADGFFFALEFFTNCAPRLKRTVPILPRSFVEAGIYVVIMRRPNGYCSEL